MMVASGSAGLTRTLIAAHRMPGAPALDDAAPGTPCAVRPAQVVVDETHAALALLALAALPARPELRPSGLVVLERDGLRSGAEVIEEHRYVAAAARAAGFPLSRPGNGCASAVTLARFVAPGRLVLGPATWIHAVGAFGALGVPADALGLAAALAGAPHPMPIPEIVRVRLIGHAPAAVGGAEIAWTLAARLGPAGMAPRVVELAGEGVRALPFEERLALARELGALGAGSALFASDAATRAYLHAQERDSDWRAIELEFAPDDPVIEHDLTLLQPLVREPATGAVFPVTPPGAPVATVVLGPECGLEQLQTVAALLLAHGRSRTTHVHLVPGSRQLRESLAAIGLLEPLAAAGVAFDDPAAPEWAGHVAAPGAGVACGVPADTLPEGVWWQAGPWLAAAAAATGRLGDPRTLAERSGRAADAPLGFRVTVDDGLLTRPASGGDPSPPPLPDGLAPPAAGVALAGSLRAVVLLEARDGVPVLAWGPRLAALGARIARLAEQVFATADPDFAARARAHTGVAVLCRGAYRSGGPPVLAALALGALGVGAVIAKEFTPADRDALAGQGILPLRPAAPGDLARVHAGDELEVPDLPDGLAPRRALVVRDLTRGHQLLLRHDLDASVVATVRAGGRLAEAAAQLAPVPVEA